MTRRELLELAADLLLLLAKGQEEEVGLILAGLTDRELHEIAKILAS